MKYVGKGELKEHINAFNDFTELHQVSDLAKCQCFAVTLLGEAKKWYKGLVAGLIVSWQQFASLYLQQFQARLQFSMSLSYLSNILQEKGESLTSYLRRFQSEQTKVVNTPEESIKTLLIAGVRPQTEFWNELQREDHVSLAQFYKMAEKHQRVESSLEALKGGPSGSNIYQRPDRATDKRRIPDRVEMPHFNKRSRPEFRERESIARFVEYTLLVASLSHIYEVSNEVRRAPRPDKIKVSPFRRDSRKYCRFHRDIGHNTDECQQLKDAIEELIRRGHLKDFVKEEKVVEATEKSVENE